MSGPAPATLPATPTPAAVRHAPLWLLAMATFAGTLGMHIFVPALPAAAADLHTGVGAMQLTISLYILGLACGQLVYGPLADWLGRRPVLMAGLLLYIVAGIAAAFAPQVQALVAARLLQALGGCAGLVLGRTIVRDTAPTSEAAQRLALMNLMVTLGPSVAPLAGGGLAETVGWRSIFLLLAGLGSITLVAAWRLLPETRGALAAVRAPTLPELRHHYRHLLGSRAFIGFSVGGGCATTSMYAFVAAAPFVFVHELHRPLHEAGIYIALLVSGVWLGSVLTSRLISRVGLGRLLVRANALSCIAAAVLLTAVLLHRLSVPIVVGAMFVYTVGVGMAAPAALTQAISVNPQVIGSASGLYGFVQMAVGAVCTAAAGLGSRPALSAALVLAAAGAVAQAAFAVALRDLRRPTPP